MPDRGSAGRQLTNARVRLATGELEHAATCTLIVEQKGTPPHWHGRLWALSPATTLKRDTKATLRLPNGNEAEVLIERVGAGGAYEFRGEGLPPSF